MSERAIAESIVHLGHIAQGDGFVAGHTPAQWTALRYFARANRFSRTPSAFAEFHGTTRGTASQTTKSLVAQGCLVRTRSQADGRSARLDLTDKAKAILADDPFEALVQAAGALTPSARGQLANALERMLGHTVDAAAAHLRFQRLDRQPQLGRKQIRSNGDLAVSDGDDGRWEGAHGGLSSAKVRFIAEFRPGEKLMQSSWISASASGSPTKPHR